MTFNYEYSPSNTDNLPLPVQMQLLEKVETFAQSFIAFLEYPLNLDKFKKNSEPHGSSIFDVIDSKRRVYLHV